jgi:small subunit ribosomal protein S8
MKTTLTGIAHVGTTNNSLADFLSRMRAGAQGRKRSIFVANTRLANDLLRYFLRQNLIVGYQLTEDLRSLEVFFRHGTNASRNVLSQLSLISKPGRRVYLKFEKLTTHYKRKGQVLVSTPAGLLHHRLLLGEPLRKFRLGGEPLILVRH